MNMKVIRYFGGFLKAQVDWLNRMADRGFRLVRAGRLMYEFEPCEPSRYEYRVEFVADKPPRQAEDYRRFIEDMGYRTFTKNINLNYSFGKARWRPWAKGTAQVAVSPGNYNKEIIIVERERDGKPFELYTESDANAIASYYASMRNQSALNGILLGIIFVICMFANAPVLAKIILAVLSLLFLIQAFFFALVAQHMYRGEKGNE